MVKQKVKQLKIEGLSKSTEPKWVFLKRLPLALTLTPPPSHLTPNPSTCIVGYRHLTLPATCET